MAASETSGLGANATVAQLYRRFVEAPDSVDAAWQGFFADLDEDARSFMAGLAGLAVDGGGGVDGNGRPARRTAAWPRLRKASPATGP